MKYDIAYWNRVAKMANAFFENNNPQKEVQNGKKTDRGAKKESGKVSG